MHRLIFLTLMLVSLMGSAKERTFAIHGTVPKTDKKYLIKLTWNSGEREKEVKIVNGKFVISGTIDAPIKALLRISEENPSKEKIVSVASLMQSSLELFLDEGTITVTTKASLSLAEVKGTLVVNDFHSYNIQIRPLNELLIKIYEAKGNYDSKGEPAQILNQMITYQSDLAYFEEMRFVKTHPSSPVSLYFVKKSLGWDMNLVKAMPMFSLLSDTLLKTDSGKKLKGIVELAKKTMIGATAVDFVQPDVNGNNIALSSLKGKYVLVDFWASWCVPCRAEGPNMIKAYDKFVGRNFEILAVTLDDSKDKWVKAIEEDKYTWPQTGDMKGWDNAAAREYGVGAVPFNVLLDPSGVIIARNLKGEALLKKLEEILK